jgi:hypothetical protein
MESTPDAVSDAGGDEEIQPLRDGDATTTANPADDPAQAEWDATTAADEGRDEATQTATGRDPDEIPDADDEIPFDDLHSSGAQPETQDDDPVAAELGEDGQGDLAPEDL